MVSMLTYNSKAKELQITKELVDNLAAYLSEEKWETTYVSSLQEVSQYFAKQPLVNLACYDVTEKDSITCLSNIRKSYKDMLLMLIADMTLSPMEYVRPDILASSLILRPFSKEALKDKLRDMIMEYVSGVEDGDAEDAFILETREGKTRIPYNQIYYMEARDKKIYLRLQNKELAFYDTIEELEEKLPDTFLRCHRSFLVNQTYIEKILLSQSEIILSHNMSVPLSRSYKPRFKMFR
ncbi:MAG: LytTR family transcriptional regulator DNA-binding domain-containing protein [Lachnospiraceae bacterium]|nr:LytTR family transcriptional regulator DNA-binding domain-containing protein [Lachnospiraceae bacterium]